MPPTQKLIWPILLLGLLILLFTACGARQTAVSPLNDVAVQPDQPPQHPFEHMGIASLTPSIGMPDNAITKAQAVNIVTERTWGAYRDELVKDYPPSAIPAVYDARKSVTGPLQRSCQYGWSRWKDGDHQCPAVSTSRQVRKTQRLSTGSSRHPEMSAYLARAMPMLTWTPSPAKYSPAGIMDAVGDNSCWFSRGVSNESGVGCTSGWSIQHWC
jgi:hypothetical protein